MFFQFFYFSWYKILFVTVIGIAVSIIIGLPIFYSSHKRSVNFKVSFYHSEEFGSVAEILDVPFKFYMRDFDVTFWGSDAFHRTVRTVRFQNLDIDFIPPKVFTSFANMERLEILNSTFEFVDQNTFKNGESVKELILERNQIKYLDNRAFLPLKNLEDLNMEKNEIGYLKEGIFSNNPKLKSLNLKSNKIDMIDPSLMKDFSRIGKVDLTNNLCISSDKFDETDLKKCFENSLDESKKDAMRNIYKSLVEKSEKELEIIPEIGLRKGWVLIKLYYEMIAFVVLYGYAIYSMWWKLINRHKYQDKDD